MIKLLKQIISAMANDGSLEQEIIEHNQRMEQLKAQINHLRSYDNVK